MPGDDLPVLLACQDGCPEPEALDGLGHLVHRGSVLARVLAPGLQIVDGQPDSSGFVGHVCTSAKYTRLDSRKWDIADGEPRRGGVLSLLSRCPYRLVFRSTFLPRFEI